MLAEALRSLPGGLFEGKFGPGEIPVTGTATSANFTGLQRERDPTRYVGDGQGTSIVQAILNWYINTFPEAVLRVTQPDAKSGKRIAVTPHELTDLLETPNPFYGGDELLAGLIISDIVDGNAYLLKLRNQSTRVVELWWIPHTIIEPMASRNPLGPFIEYYEYKVSGRRYELAPSEVVHLRHGLDPQNPRKGMARLKGQLREVMADEEAARFSAAIVQNLGVPGLVISPKGDEQDISDEDGELIKLKIDQKVGSSNRGRTIVLSGATDVHQFGFNPQQMDLSAVRGVPEERVSAALSVPAAVVGFGTGLSQTKVGATMKELREMAVEQGLVPMWRRFAKALHRQLMYEFQTTSSDYQLGYDTSEVRVLQEDRQLLHQRTREDVSGGLLDVATGQALLGYPVDESQRIYLRSGMLIETPVGVGGTQR